MNVKTLNFNQKISEPTVVALGFFDCIHLGHKKLVSEAKRYAEQYNVKSALLTFTNDPNVVFGGEKQIYTFEDRTFILDKLGLDFVIGARFDVDFAHMSARDFFLTLVNNFNVKALIVGEDYTFGINAEGDTSLLADLCNACGIELTVVPFEKIDGRKLSTSNLKTLVKLGDVSRLNSLLASEYFVRGEVLHAKHNGTQMGFPTANIAVPDDRLPLGDGIYATIAQIDGKSFYSMTNVGAKPTFGDLAPSIETYIFDFDADLYGKELRLYFVERVRDIIKFDSPTLLSKQLEQDEKTIRALLEKHKFEVLI